MVRIPNSWFQQFELAEGDGEDGEDSAIMFGGSVLNHQGHHLIKPTNPTNSSEQWNWEQNSAHLVHRCKSIEEFKQVHAQFTKFGFDQVSRHARDLVTACALSSWGTMEYSHSIFQRIYDPKAFEFNTMIRGYVMESDADSALLLFVDMLERDLKPDNFTFPFVVKACAQLSAADEGLQIHGHVCKNGLETDAFVQNTLISMYGKCGEIKLSCSVFEQMGTQRNAASWSSLIAAHSRLGLWSECLELSGAMTSEGWRADESTMVSLLSSCAHLGALDLGRSTHASSLRNISALNVILQTSLIDFYVKCGCLEKGLFIFEKMLHKNTWTYSVIISGLGMHGDGEKALWVFSDMLKEGLKPDGIVYVAVLSACSHAGLLAEGLRCFDQMRFEHQIVPMAEHYACMVDLMARAGRLAEAHEFIRRMPLEPNDVVWRSLLSGCKVYANLELGKISGRNLLQLDPHNAGDSALLSNINAQALQWDDVAKIRTDMVNRGLSQVPGFSRVEVKRHLHTFVSQDQSHPKSNSIYEMLHQMEWQLRFEGYIPESSQVLFDVDEEKKRQLLASHSQKLAIAFALLSSDRGSQIRIVKNLRMCQDCHTYTKLISKIFDREIMVRDRKRFHHFREGACSCRDYW